MEIGKPLRTIIVEPVEDPFRREEPSEAPAEAPARETEREPELVPAS